MPSYKELEYLSIPKQAQLLLRSASRFAQIGSFNIYNLNMAGGPGLRSLADAGQGKSLATRPPYAANSRCARSRSERLVKT